MGYFSKEFRSVIYVDDYEAFKIGERINGTDDNSFDSLYNFTTNRMEELFSPPTEFKQQS